MFARKDRRRHYRRVTFALASLLALTSAELALRAFLAAYQPRLRTDATNGWRCVEGLRRRSTVVDAGGRRRSIDYSTDAHGFRTRRVSAAGRRRIFVIGDSFTQGAAVSDDETYHALLGEHLDADVFAYGAGGYGTLQELMILEEHVARIRPDCVLWQLCTNDLINNDAALERASAWDNNAMRRPYLEAGRVRHELPKRLATLRELGETYRILWAAFLCWDRASARWGATVEDDLRREGTRHAGLRRSVATTEALLSRARARAAPATFLAFTADERPPYSQALREIAARLAIPLHDEVPRALRAARERGVVTHAADRAHWNDVGHRICAEELARFVGPRLVR